MPAYVTLAELADEVGRDRSSYRKWALSNGVRFERVRHPGTRGQEALALPLEAAAQVRQMYADYYGGDIPQPTSVPSAGNNGNTANVSNGEGFFYVVQLVPELAPGRVKLGFAAIMASRLAEHRCAAPTATVLRHWPCRRAWEVAVMASLTREGCTALSYECFDCDDAEALLARGDAFFALMPEV